MRETRLNTHSSKGNWEHRLHLHILRVLSGGVHQTPPAHQLTTSDCPEGDMLDPNGHKLLVRVRSELPKEDALGMTDASCYLGTCQRTKQTPMKLWSGEERLRCALRLWLTFVQENCLFLPPLLLGKNIIIIRNSTDNFNQAWFMENSKKMWYIPVKTNHLNKTYSNNKSKHFFIHLFDNFCCEAKGFRQKIESLQ